MVRITEEMHCIHYTFFAKADYEAPAEGNMYIYSVIRRCGFSSNIMF